MDIARPDLSRTNRRKRLLLIASLIGVAGLISLGLDQLKPALPTLDGSAFTDTVKRGDMLRDVRGNGTLVPEEIRWITAMSAGRVERIPLLPGEIVNADTILVELSNPELEQAVFDAESLWQAAEAQLETRKVELESDRLTQVSLIASLKSDLALAKIEAQADEELRKDGLTPGLTAKRSRTKAEELDSRLQIENERLEITAQSARAQIREKETEVAKLKKQHHLKERQLQALNIKAGFEGVLQRLGDERPLQIGQQVLIGANIARIANPAKLKAQIRLAETLARDVQHGQLASIDTRNGVIPGHVIRIDPASENGMRTVDVKLDGPLPRGAVPELNVDGTITIERLEDVLYVGRPASGHPESNMNLFKVVEEGKRALRVPVKLGRSSITSIEIIQGLKVGDQIILTDMSQYGSYKQLRLK